MPKPPLPDELDALLREPNPAVIATLKPDGAPHSVATWYLWEDGRVLVNMDDTRARLDYLRSDPRVSLTVLDADDWYRHVSLRGPRRLDRSPTRTSRTSTGSPSTTAASRTRPRPPAHSAWIEIDTLARLGRVRYLQRA